MSSDPDFDRLCDDLEQLRDSFPLWQFGTVRASIHPAERRNLVATREAVVVGAPDAVALAAKVAREEALRGWRRR